MKILVIEDDSIIVETIRLTFQVGWPETEIISTRLGEEGIDLVETESPDVIILDLGLPDISGFEVLKGIRLFSNIPVVVLTVSEEETNIVRALEWGANEYIIKPFRHLEFLARIKSILRMRSFPFGLSSVACGPFTFDFINRKVMYGNKTVNLTNTESLILHQLVDNKGKIVSHSMMANGVWDTDYPGAHEAIRVYIRHLRQKIEGDPNNPKFILTKPGVGYSFIIPH